MKRHSLVFTLLLSSLAVLKPHDPMGAQEVSAKVWVGHADEIEAVLNTGNVISMEDLGEGRNKPKRVILEKDGRKIRAVWKPIELGVHPWAWESYQAEVAAYSLDKLLSLNMVPPTVARSFGEDKGSLQFWVEGAKLYERVQDQTPSTVEWNRELSRMRTFDTLICNPDRRPGNFMVDPQWNIILIDHSQCFLSREGLPEAREMVPTHFDRRLVARLQALDLERLQVRFRGLLMDSQISCMEKRREALLVHIQKLIARRGEKAVLF